MENSTPALSKQIESSEASMDSPFFSLPLEIRNSIYEYALGESRTLSHNGDLVVAVPQFPPRLCAEAVDVFIRTRAFESISPHSIVNDRGLPVAQPDANQTIWDLLKSMNPLIFKEDGIQIIALRPSGATGYSKSSTGTPSVRRQWNIETIPRFLKLMKRYGTRNMCLVMGWERYWDMRGCSWSSPAPGWIDREKDIHDHPCLDDEWNGKFRKVTIKIEYHSKDGNATEKMVELAEASARRLVGANKEQKMGWTEEVESIERGKP